EEAAENAEYGRQLDRLKEPGRHVLAESDEGILVVHERGYLRRVVQAVAGRQRIHHEYVEDTDCPQRAGHGQGNAACRGASLLTERRRGVEPDEGQETEDNAQSDTREPGRRGPHEKDGGGVAVSRGRDGQRPEDE